MGDAFTPTSGLAGGALIGLAASLLLLGSGRVAGISGILGRAIFGQRGDIAWRVAFLGGLPLGAAVIGWLAPRTTTLDVTSSPALLITAGLLVGFGTQLGNGCTSGHGVCGIGRGSARSIVATLTFMATAVVTVFVARHAIGTAP